MKALADNFCKLGRRIGEYFSGPEEQLRERYGTAGINDSRILPTAKGQIAPFDGAAPIPVGPISGREIGRGSFNTVYEAKSHVDGKETDFVVRLAHAHRSYEEERSEAEIIAPLINKFDKHEGESATFRPVRILGEVEVHRRPSDNDILDRVGESTEYFMSLESWAEKGPKNPSFACEVAHGIAMERAPGMNLAQALECGIVPTTSEMQDLISGLRAWISEAARMGLIHVDLKPSNIFYLPADPANGIPKAVWTPIDHTPVTQEKVIRAATGTEGIKMTPGYLDGMRLLYAGVDYERAEPGPAREKEFWHHAIAAQLCAVDSIVSEINQARAKHK